MAKDLDKERAAIAADEARLADRKKQLAEKERDLSLKAIERAGLLKLSPEDLEALLARVRKLGFEEVRRRLAA
ncbi:hypothetical protein SAMN05518849_12834 [Sphingobium sp. AP50]|uniref:hypothetical protein n=1 Tax=Sphingobium sp. AP50 TaxID=1884369 RepID=UPI0008BBA081|nr:hypothetical protein [Sphingobium sp. AP50]SEK02209.1 hypothetical protein SAMN05518849_12834 [Sphingobium sp. AP50]